MRRRVQQHRGGKLLDVDTFAVFERRLTETSGDGQGKERTLLDALVDQVGVEREGDGYADMRNLGEEILALARVLDGCRPGDTNEDPESDTGPLGFDGTADDIRERIDGLTDLIADMHAVLQHEKTNPTPLAF